jgi:hypothetical protein
MMWLNMRTYAMDYFFDTFIDHDHSYFRSHGLLNRAAGPHGSICTSPKRRWSIGYSPLPKKNVWKSTISAPPPVISLFS